MWMCGAMVVGALILVLATGSAFLPVIGCVLMMQMMGGMGGRDRNRDSHRS
jgi:hypothetical protein